VRIAGSLMYRYHYNLVLLSIHLETKLTMLLSKLYRLVEPGGNLHRYEWLVYYSLGSWFTEMGGSWGQRLLDLAFWNAACQLCLFLPVVQLPALLTGHMSYVDIGWPVGLTLMGLNAIFFAEGGNSTRQYLVGGVVFLHGLRMVFGALHMLFPYRWSQEFFSRYQYARARWIEHTGSDSGWWIKQQHDTLMQAYANSVPLAAPIFLAATNPRPTLHFLEVGGAVCWFTSWCLENWADVSKLIWELEAKENGTYLTTVLGHHPPYNQGTYYIWSICRHPNVSTWISCFAAVVVCR
jgi:steroid 5-alpha reductase family enzyme